MTDFIDELHKECYRAAFEIGVQFARAKADASIWEPAPCPPAFVLVSDRTPYLDEVTRIRGWFRS